MLGSALPAPATIHTTTSSATPTSPTRPSRLRGLSYLRSYTHNHLHSTSSRSDSPQLARSTSTPADDPSREFTSPRRRETDLGGSGQTSNIQSGENGWLPSVQGRSGLSRDSLDPTSSSEFAQSETSNSTAMTRSRGASVPGPTPTSTTRPTPRRPSQAEGMSNDEQSGETVASGPALKETLPSLRFIPHVETRAARPSLQFLTVSRTLKQPNSIIKVGRYSERDNATQKDTQHVSPIGFKSKVVSRRHCEFWCVNGQWFVKDVKSSSGTFLNHVRLSQPGMESRPYPVNDGDVVQLGIDFKGGEEVIFRCVKIRVECNRGWQKSLNSFNTSAHKKLLKNAGLKTKSRDSDAASTNSSECSICLNPVAPCQALFVAPCSHVWHFKCVRNLINGPNFPNFLCPNCRFVADLEADTEPPEEMYEDSIAEEQVEEFDDGPGSVMSDEGENRDERNNSEDQPPSRDGNTSEDEDMSRLLDSTTLDQPNGTSHGGDETLTSRQASSRPLTIRPRPSENDRTPSADLLSARSATPTSNTQFALAAGVMSMNEGLPMTPRNNAGPFVFDGAGPRGLAEQVVAESDEPESSPERR